MTTYKEPAMFQMDIRPKVIRASEADRRVRVREVFLLASLGLPDEGD